MRHAPQGVLGRKRRSSDERAGAEVALKPLVRSSAAYDRWTRLRRWSRRSGVLFVVMALVCAMCLELGVVFNNLLIDLDNLVSPRDDAPGGGGVPDRGAARVREYMERQWAAVENGREDFLLWDYFDLKAHEELGSPRPPASWSDLIVARMTLWAKRLQFAKDNRFVIEKDKCAMFRMLRQLGLPHPRVRLEWREADYGDGRRLRAYLLNEGGGEDGPCAYPAILKVGHIHQQKSTIFLPSASDVRARVDDYVAWVDDKMRSKFVDRASWADQTNPLYASIDACLIVQDVANPEDFGGDAVRAARPLEMMVEVVWGRSVQGVLTVDAEGELVLGKPQYKNTAEFVVLRDGWAAYKWPYLSRDGVVFSRRYTNPRSHVRAHRKARESWFRYDTDPAVDDGAADADDACEGVRATERATCLRPAGTRGSTTRGTGC